jgi:hypothetical protein
MLATLFSEMASLFDDEYFHIGADEVNANCWQQDDHIGSVMREQKLSITDLIQTYEDRVQTLVRSLGKTVMHWEDILTRDFRLNIDKRSVVQVRIFCSFSFSCSLVVFFCSYLLFPGLGLPLYCLLYTVVTSHLFYHSPLGVAEWRERQAIG